MLRTTYLLRPFPLTSPTLTGYRQMYALKLMTWRQDGHSITNLTTFTAASWEMLFEIGTNWSISASSRSLHRPLPSTHIAPQVSSEGRAILGESIRQ